MRLSKWSVILGAGHGKLCPTPRPSATDGQSTEATAQKYICTSCGFIYDPVEGDPDGGLAPGTPFEDIPDDWFCPVCGARKKDFELLEE